jgi:glycosyltransferase involved in cell wall biosynthesis
MAALTCYQVNLQESLGGGEIYTRFLTKALQDLGWQTVLFVNARAGFWAGLGLEGTSLVPVRSLDEIEAYIPQPRPLVITHVALAAEPAARFASRSVLTGFLHMPLYERFPDGLRHYHTVFGVSEYVVASARSRGLGNVYPEALYGIADLSSRGKASKGMLCAGSVYDWDRRKLRDRLLGCVAPLASSLQAKRYFERRQGLTLGVVSRLTPIKQFPLMFELLVPAIARFPRVNLEIFGSGGYASVRDLKRVLAPLGSQVRFWGYQNDVATVYPQLDYVLSGLPEKEALGLNLLEAQRCGTPVLAVRSPPFDEILVNGETGYFFEDPRRDQGRSFGALIEGILDGMPRPQPQRASAHLARFSADAFRSRLRLALEATTPCDQALV